MSRLFRYLAKEIFWATLLLLFALLALFALFDFIREMSDLGKGQYRFATLSLYVLLTQPTHLVVVFPMAALMGTLFAIARLSAQSELTVMRASGLSLMRLAVLCAVIGFAYSAVVLLFGEFVAPSTEEWAKRTKVNATTNVIARQFRSGFWMKDDLSFVNIGNVTADREIHEIRIYEFDRQYRLTSLSVARSGAYDVAATRWLLKDVNRTTFEGEGARIEQLPKATWNSAITPGLISVLLVRPDSMPISSLFSFIDHLRNNQSNSTQYELAFWSKAFQPVTTVVMMLLAIPFAIQPHRSRGVGAMMIAGILAGLGVYFLNQLAGNLTVINDWPPLASVGIPHAIFFAISIAMITLKERPIRWRARKLQEAAG